MVTPKSKRTGGPRTAKGKAIASRNALKHGLTAKAVIIPGERAKDWQEHRQALFSDLKPVGMTEAIMAERVALMSWRLNRIARFESANITASIDSVEDEITSERHSEIAFKHDMGMRVDYNVDVPNPQDLFGQVEYHRDCLRLLEQFPKTPGNAAVDSPDAVGLIWDCERAARVLVSSAGVELTPVEELSVPPVPDGVDLEEFSGWTADIVRSFITIVAEEASTTLDELVERARSAAVRDSILASFAADRLRVQIDRRKASRALPDPLLMDKLSRYESATERSLYRALQELQRLQARRGSGAMPPVVDVNVDAGG